MTQLLTVNCFTISLSKWEEKIMVTQQYVDQQLRKISFHQWFWGRAEILELTNILMPNEEVFECVNGNYEGGFALLVVTNERLLLIDKKPFQFLTVEDMRFGRINQIDYSYRLIGAYINVNAGLKNLRFTSLNKIRLRKLVSHIQISISELRQMQSVQFKRQEQHLENINEHLKLYLNRQDDNLLTDKLNRVNKSITSEDHIGNHSDNFLEIPRDILPIVKEDQQTLLELGRNELFSKKKHQLLNVIFNKNDEVVSNYSNLFKDAKPIHSALGKLIISQKFTGN